jgi:hypothetical protein
MSHLGLSRSLHTSDCGDVVQSSDLIQMELPYMAEETGFPTNCRSYKSFANFIKSILNLKQIAASSSLFNPSDRQHMTLLTAICGEQYQV